MYLRVLVFIHTCIYGQRELEALAKELAKEKHKGAELERSLAEERRKVEVFARRRTIKKSSEDALTKDLLWALPLVYSGC